MNKVLWCLGAFCYDGISLLRAFFGGGFSLNGYEINHLAEIYDQYETETHDVEYLLAKIKESGIQNVLEPFCGTGRILLPIAQTGCQITGLDGSDGMLKFLEEKARQLSEQTRSRITLKLADVLKTDWPGGYDLVILGGNCFYELASVQEQRHVIRAAYQALKPGGALFTDGDCMDGLLDESWCDIGVEGKAFPSGVCAHGVHLQGYCTTVAVDRENRIWKAHRRAELKYPDGRKEEAQWDVTVHPTSVTEMRTWIEGCGFEIREAFAGTETRGALLSNSGRATFWAVKP